MDEFADLVFDECPDVEGVVGLIEQMLAAMMEAQFPPDGVISQFGVSMGWGMLDVSVSSTHMAPPGNNFMVMVYHRNRVTGMPGRWYKLLLKELDARVGVMSHWNGGDGHAGVSVVTSVVATDDYSQCYANYRGLSPQDKEMELFHAEWRRAFMEVTGLGVGELDAWGDDYWG